MPTPVPTATLSTTLDSSDSQEVEFWELDMSSTGQDLVALLTDEEAACLENELGANYQAMLEAPLAGEAGALVEEGGSDAFPLPRCFTVERAASMSLSLFSAAADGFSAGTQECMLQLLTDNPAIAEALGQGQAFIDGPAILKVVACLSPEEAAALTPPGEGPAPNPTDIACLMQELEGTPSGERIIAVLSGVDASRKGLTMEESAALGRAVEACGIETDFGFPDATASPTFTPTPVPVSTPGSTITPTPTEASVLRGVEDDLTLLVVAGPIVISVYDREEWRHWIDEDGDCQDTRQEVLITESETPVTYTDPGRCRVASGTWNGPYTGEVFTDPRGLDIDHMVPLAEAHYSGGWKWSEEKRRQYANLLTYEGHLIAVQASENRSKGSRGPAYWKPPNRNYWCQYAIDWITIKTQWNLFGGEDEAAALAEMLKTCTPSRTLTVVPYNIPLPAGTPSPIPPLSVSYESCEAAEAAGESRVQGSNGTGRGFPQDKVPSARDGDGDGVVCER